MNQHWRYIPDTGNTQIYSIYIFTIIIIIIIIIIFVRRLEGLNYKLNNLYFKERVARNI